MSEAKETWYVYDPEDGIQSFATEADALLGARLKIETYRDRQLMEWHDGVDGILVLKKVCGVRDASSVHEFEDWRLEIDCQDTPQG